MAEAGSQKRPSLTALLDRYGTWPRIPYEAWREHDQAMATWIANMHKVIRTSTLASGLHLITHTQDYRRFIDWLDQHDQPVELARALWKALSKEESKRRLEQWMRQYQQETNRSASIVENNDKSTEL